MSEQQNIFRDRIAVATMTIGLVLMVVTLLTRVNPVEGSVVRPRWLVSTWATPIHLTLLGSCLPAMMACYSVFGMMEQHHLTFPGCENICFGAGVMLVVQAVLYFAIGKLISFAWRKWQVRRNGAGRGPCGARGEEFPSKPKPN